MALDRLSSMGTSFNDSVSDEAFQSLKGQQKKVQGLIEEYNTKMVDNSLRSDDLTIMNAEMKKLSELEEAITCEQMGSNYVLHKTMSLKMVQESYRLCNWVIEKQFNEVDNVFDVDTFVMKIFEACAGQENPLVHINTLFKGVLKNTNCFNLNFYGNIQSSDIDDSNLFTQSKREYNRSQKRQLEELVVPDEAESGVGDNDLQISLKRVHRCLKEAVANNRGKPIPFYKFAIDPFSLTYTVENLFNLASLVKDGSIKIERISDDECDEFTTVTVAKNLKNDNNKGNIRASFFTINEDLWKFYVKKYNITERMIEQNK